MWEFETHKQEFFFLIQVLGTFYEFHNHYNALFYFKLKQNRLALPYSWNINLFSMPSGGPS